jgi:hypothetical protein
MTADQRHQQHQCRQIDEQQNRVVFIEQLRVLRGTAHQVERDEQQRQQQHDGPPSGGVFFQGFNDHADQSLERCQPGVT